MRRFASDVDCITGHYGSCEVAQVDGRGRVALDTIFEYLVVAYSEDDISCWASEMSTLMLEYHKSMYVDDTR